MAMTLPEYPVAFTQTERLPSQSIDSVQGLEGGSCAEAGAGRRTANHATNAAKRRTGTIDLAIFGMHATGER